MTSQTGQAQKYHCRVRVFGSGHSVEFVPSLSVAGVRRLSLYMEQLPRYRYKSGEPMDIYAGDGWNERISCSNVASLHFNLWIPDAWYSAAYPSP